MVEKNTQSQGKENFAIQRIFIKDVSFESPHAPESLKATKWEPEVNMDLSSDFKEMEKGIFSVILKTTVTAKQDNKDIFLVEVQQGGVFSISGFNDEQQDHLLGSFAPSVLFPYLRQTVSDLVVQGGYPPLYLAPINFDAYYAEKKKREADGEQTKAANESETTTDQVH